MAGEVANVIKENIEAPPEQDLEQTPAAPESPPEAPAVPEG